MNKLEENNKNNPDRVFQFFNEIGIINQLSTALLAKVLPDGVHPSHFGLLGHLTKRGDGSTPVKIASAMQVTKATMTHSLSVLEKLGYIEIHPNSEDARSKIVRITEVGRRFHAKSSSDVIRRFGHILSTADVARMEEALPALQQIRVLLDNQRD